jgi:hypothetical protein
MKLQKSSWKHALRILILKTIESSYVLKKIKIWKCFYIIVKCFFKSIQVILLSNKIEKRPSCSLTIIK